MSEWHLVKDEYIEINNSDCTIEVYVKHDDNGAIYVEIPIEMMVEKLNNVGEALCNMLADVLAEICKYEFYPEDENEGFSVSVDNIAKVLSKYFS